MIPLEGGAYALDSADLDNDGRLDLVAANSGGFAVLWGCDGTPAPADPPAPDPTSGTTTDTGASGESSDTSYDPLDPDCCLEPAVPLDTPVARQRRIQRHGRAG